MGSCFSNTDDRKNKDSNSSVSGKNRAPPSQSPVCEEESVKEVLSETPMIKSDEDRVEKKARFHNPVLGTVSEDEEQPELLKIRDGVPDALVPGKPGYFFRSDKREDEISDASEICSLTVSENVSTVTVNDGRRDSAEEEEEVMQQQKQRMKQRSPARTRHCVPGNNNDTNFYPSRRSGQSPARNTGGGGFTGPVRLVQPERDYVGGGARLTGMRSGSFRKDTGERSGRRSRSPATNRTVTGPASVGSRRSNQSPGRVRLDPKERKMEQYGKRPNSGMNNHNHNHNNGGRELLENPLVSLECFIFL